MSIKSYPLISDWLAVQGDRLVVKTGKVDIGQRISTALTQIAHEELGVPLQDIDVAPVRTGESPDEGMTSGSNSVEQSGQAVRKASATLRGMLIEHAAATNGGNPEDWELSEGRLIRKGSNLSLSIAKTIGELDLSASIDAHAASSPASAKPPKPAMRGLTEMVTGQYVFVHDLEIPGMLHARVVRPPQAMARLKGISRNATDQLADERLELIRDGSFLAIAGPVEWQVVKAARRFAAACDWEDNGGLPEEDVFEQLKAENAERLEVVGGVPHKRPVPAPLTGTDFSARYEKPYLMHGALAPSAAMAVWSSGRLEITCHSQGIYPLRESIADSLGLSLEQVVITHRPGSGCYGHNGADDAAFEAALIAMALPDTPVLLKWTREEEHRWEPYAPAMAVELAVTLSDAGKITGFSAEAFSDTHRGRPRPGPDRAGPSRLLANRLRAEALPAPVALPNMNKHGGMHRNLDPIYTVGDKRLVKNLVAGLPLRTSALRCLGATANIFALESLMDELAEKQGQEPLAFRRAHLDDPRALAVIDKLEERMAETPAPGDMSGRGFAYAQYKNAMTRVGVCVDIEVGELGEIVLQHAIIVADAGRVIDEDGLRAQLEGGSIQAASWAIYEEMHWDRDGITSTDWDSYPVIRFDNVPTMDIVVLDVPGADPVGAGEASPGPTIAAIANALYNATGLRMRRLPFTADAILRHATAL
jgi:CO/xanthine dehydrogenase Mo-binding subunit